MRGAIVNQILAMWRGGVMTLSVIEITLPYSTLFSPGGLFRSMATRGTEKEAEEEQIHFQNVITAIQQYAPYTVCPFVLLPRSRA